MYSLRPCKHCSRALTPQGEMCGTCFVSRAMAVLIIIVFVALLSATICRGEPDVCDVGQMLCNPDDPTECEQYGRIWTVRYEVDDCPPEISSEAVAMRVYFYYTAGHGPWLPMASCPTPPQPDNLCLSVDELVWEPHAPVYVECTKVPQTGDFLCPVSNYPMPLLKLYDYPMLRPGREYAFATRRWWRMLDGIEGWTPGYTIMYDPWRNPELRCQRPPYTSEFGSDLCWPEYMECPLGATSNLDCTIHISE